MLCFQNFHQLAQNLPQISSTISHSYVRITSASVKRKPEIDVSCSESFMNCLKSFQQSENAKLFKSLPDVEFGPKFENIQWIYCKNVNYKFKAEKSVDNLDLNVSLNKKNFPSENGAHCSGKGYGRRQKKVLAELEAELSKSSTWGESFVSGRSFTENKESSIMSRRTHCSNSNRFFSSLVGTHLRSPDVFCIQKRGFKTRRTVELEEKEKPRFFSRSRKDLAKDEEELARESIVLSQLIKDRELTDEAKQNLKLSFAEGYLAGASSATKPSGFTKFFNQAKNVLYFFFLIATGYFILISRDGKSLIGFSFNQHGEVNTEEIGVNFSDVKGLEEVKEELKEIVEFLRNPTKFSLMGGKLPKGVLLVGPPGTGKTLLARALAGEANVPFFHASGSEFDEIFVGEGARRVRKLFKAAKANAPCIIFIDEIDCVGSKRKTSTLHPHANQTINQLLNEMDGFNKNEGVIVIGATNRKEDLDSALLRPGRFDFEVLVPLPETEERKDILEFYLSKVVSKNIDVSRLANVTEGCSGADLEAIVNYAAIRAASRSAPHITMEYLIEAKEKILLGPERKALMKNGEGITSTAYHEGGHAIVAYFTEGIHILDTVTIVPRGGSLGHTSIAFEEHYKHYTKGMLMGQLDVLMGGRAAEELIFGTNKVSANCASDFQKATSLATEMVKKYGMSDKVGVRVLNEYSAGGVSLNDYGQMTADQVDMEVKRLLQESLERAKNILKKHSKEHKLLAEALLKYKTLHPEDLQAIIGDNSEDKVSRPSAAASN